MTCRLEKEMTDLLLLNGIDFSRPEQDKADPTTLDFYLPKYDTYIEVKLFHTPRIDQQLSKVPKGCTAILIQGLDGVKDFELLCKAVRAE